MKRRTIAALAASVIGGAVLAGTISGPASAAEDDNCTPTADPAVEKCLAWEDLVGVWGAYTLGSFFCPDDTWLLAERKTPSHIDRDLPEGVEIIGGDLLGVRITLNDRTKKWDIPTGTYRLTGWSQGDVSSWTSTHAQAWAYCTNDLSRAAIFN